MNVAWLGGSFTFAILLGVVTGEGLDVRIHLASIWPAQGHHMYHHMILRPHMIVTERSTRGCAGLKPRHRNLVLAERTCMNQPEYTCGRLHASSFQFLLDSVAKHVHCWEWKDPPTLWSPGACPTCPSSPWVPLPQCEARNILKASCHW